MITRTRPFKSRVHWLALPTIALLALLGVSFVASDPVSANHPVLVEGNCDSPVPGTTLVAPGTCGDYDGDGRIGTAEDTDGADRIFGTINAALGPGTGAAASTGANHNGTVQIVASGRFAEAIYIGQNISGPGGPGATSPGNVTLEAAPGVIAIIDAVLQGDPAGGNATRQNGTGIQVTYTVDGQNRRTVLRNLTIRNYSIGIAVFNNATVHIDNCLLENNLNTGIRVDDTSRVVITNSQVVASGFRIGGPSSVANFGNGLYMEDSTNVKIFNSVFSGNSHIAIWNNTNIAANLVLYKVSAFLNGSGTAGGHTICTDSALCQ